LEIEDVFLDERLFVITERPWFADIANLKATSVVTKGYNWNQKKKFFKDAS